MISQSCIFGRIDNFTIYESCNVSVKCETCNKKIMLHRIDIFEQNYACNLEIKFLKYEKLPIFLLVFKICSLVPSSIRHSIFRSNFMTITIILVIYYRAYFTICIEKERVISLTSHFVKLLHLSENLKVYK